EQQERRDDQQARPFPHPLPVAGRRELGERRAAAGAFVHQWARPGDERFEARHGGVACEAPARQREGGGGRPIQRAQAAGGAGGESPGPPACSCDQRVELAPPFPSCLYELVELQTRSLPAAAVTFAGWRHSTTGSPSPRPRASSSSWSWPASARA